MANVTFDDLIPAPKAEISFDDLIPADGPKNGGAAEAVARGLVSGVPVIGPLAVGAADRLSAGMRALKNDTRYSDEFAGLQARGAAAAAEHPYVDTAAQLAGGVVGTLPMVAAAPAAFGAGAGSLGTRAALAGLTGGGIGASDAAVRSGGDRTSTFVGGLLGGALGGATLYAGKVAGDVAAFVGSKIKPAEAVPSVEQLKDMARAAYSRADDAGVQIAQPAFGAAINDIGQAVREAGIDRTIHPKATAALGRLEEAAGSSPTLKDTEILRRILKGAAGSIEPDEKRVAGVMVSGLDDFVNRLKPADLVSGDAEAATSALKEARGLYGRAKRAEMVDEATLKAERRAASTGSGGNLDNATRQNIRAILDSPKRSRGFSQEEKAAMDAVVRGTTGQNATRLLGKLSPVGNGLMAALGIGATAANPMLAALPTAGHLAKMYAERATAKNISRLEQLILSGGAIPVSPLAIPFREGGETVGRILPFGILPAANQRLRLPK